MITTATAVAIAENAIKESDEHCDNKRLVQEHTIACMARACALLTSTVKSDREEGKKMVRRWKNGNSF